MVDEFLVKYLKVFFVNKTKNYANSWLEKKKVDIQNMKCYQMKLFNWIDFNILRRILNTFLEGNVVSYIIKRLNSNIIYKDIEYSNNFGLFKSKLGKLIYNILLLVVDNILMQSDDIFYYRIEDKIYSENILIPSYLNDFIVQKETLVFNDYLINENGEPLLLSSEYLSILELKLKKLIRNCNCLSFGTVASKWNDFLKNQKINNQSLPIFKKYQSKVLDCIKRGVSSRMSTRFPLLIFYTPKNLGGLGLYNLIEPTPIITDFDTPAEYFTSIVEYFGGEKKILEHSLYYFLDKVVDFENQNEPKTKVIALKRSINTLPNKKFIMWWSPTINRSRVYVGKKSLDLTGITMYGKLNSLKVNYVHLFRNHIWDGIHKKCKEYFPSYIKGEKLIHNYFYNSFNLSESNNKVNEESNVKQLKVNFKIIWSDFDTKEINGIDNGCLNVILNINYNSFVLFGCIFSENIDELKERCREALKNRLICILRDRFYNFFETNAENWSIKNDFDHLFCSFNEDVYLFEIKTGNIIHKNITGRKFRKQKISEIIQTMIREDIVVGVDEEYYQEIKDIIFQKAKIVKTKDKINFSHLLKELDTTNVYDKNWTCDSYTKYCRVALLCKALELEPTIKTSFIKNKAYIPMNDEEWIAVEYKIKDLIEKHYIKNYIKPLDQGEMKEIVFNKKPFVKKLNLKKWKPLSMLERKIVFYNSVDSWLKNFNIEPSAKNLPYDLLIKIITVNKSLKDIFIYKIEDFYVLSFFPRTMIKFKDNEWEIKEIFNIRYIFNQKYDDYDILIDENDVHLKVNLNSCEFRWLINVKNTDEFINRFPIESDFQ